MDTTYDAFAITEVINLCSVHTLQMKSLRIVFLATPLIYMYVFLIKGKCLHEYVRKVLKLFLTFLLLSHVLNKESKTKYCVKDQE